jgi:hypothetical protein
MIKAIALLKCKAGMSRQAFIEYYETRHAPLMLELQPRYSAYRRNFIDLAGAFMPPGASAPDFDVITELWYPDRAAYDETMAALQEPERFARIANDEENLFDRDRTRMFVVEEHRSDIASPQPERASAFKAIALLKSKAGLSRQAFIDYYETRHAPLIVKMQPQIDAYRRNFIDLTDAFMFPGASAPDFDVITELWYADRAAYDAALAVIGVPEQFERIARDEENFLDRNKTRMFVVEEYISKIG